ncbi:hypothetical protein DSY14_26125 [Nocardiopsis sp. MG754419]|nr:hypothetical protein [Nocardiopsis sp. MG754419]
MPRNAPPADRDPLPHALRPAPAEPSSDAVALAPTAAVRGVDLHARSTRATGGRSHVVAPPGVGRVFRHAVTLHREPRPTADRTRVEGGRVTAPVRTALDVAHGATANVDRWVAWIGVHDLQRRPGRWSRGLRDVSCERRRDPSPAERERARRAMRGIEGDAPRPVRG